MISKLKPGDRVRFIGDGSWFGPDDKRTGTVEKLYEGYDDREDGRVIPLPYPTDWAACVRVDEILSNWPYIGTDKFAPDVSELEFIA